MSGLRIEVFPARDGDCFLLHWEDGNAPTRHMLIDGGRSGTYAHLRPRLVEIADAGEALELLLLTHIDADHIEGSLKYLRDQAIPIAPRRVWYNGYDQMGGIEAFSFKQGDDYSVRLAELGLPLNQEVGGGYVCIETAPAPIDIEGLSLKILSPDRAHLKTLRDAWGDWRTAEAAKAAAKQAREEAAAAGVEVMGRKPMPDSLDVETLCAPTPTDSEPPNGSSIAFLGEWQGRRVLMAGDAHPDLFEETIAPLAAKEGGRLKVDLFKISHHGSHGNVTRGLLELVDCHRFLLSTNGSIHGHPDPEAIARILKYGSPGKKTLYFNYRTIRTDPWDNEALKRRHDYETVFADSDAVMTIDI